MNQPVWDKIYKDFQKGGKAWYTLSRGLDADFKEFVENTDFPIKKAFDVGFGTGHYLVWLKARGFEVAGIDSSETAYTMTADALGTKDGLICDSIYERDIPKESFSLIFSIHAIHHGLKDQVQKAFDNVYSSLVEGGWIYLTLPEDLQIKDWETHKTSKLIALGTHAPTEGPEKDLPHSFYSKTELEEIFDGYKKLNIKKGERGGWIITAQK